MKPVHPLDAHADRVQTRVGGAFVGERAVFRGHDLHRELQDMDWVGLYVFGITGRRYGETELKLLHAIWVCTSYPDPRIWNNRVAALAGSARSTGNLAMSAALAVSEATVYGRGIDFRAASFLTETRRRIEEGERLEDCVRRELEVQRGIAGYGRPIAAADERIAPMLALMERLGLPQGPHLRLAFEVERYLLQGRWRWRMNYGALAAALTADLGFTPQEHYAFCYPAFLAGMQPCYLEASEKPEGTLLPLACRHIDYQGQAKRDWPPARD